MLSKNQIKFVNSLKQKKFRETHNLFIAEGTKIVSELLNSSIVVKQIYATSDFFRNNRIENSIERFEIKENELSRISALTTPNEVLAIAEIPYCLLNIDALKDKLILILDDIKDPGNLGTIIRIADWYGIETIICSNETAEAYNPKVVQATMGSISRVKLHYVDLVSFLQELTASNQQPIFGTVLNGENIYKTKLPENAFIIIGNESKGISEKVFPFITDKIAIPSFSNNSYNNSAADSLNAAIATAIICSEFRRKYLFLSTRDS